MRGILYQIWSEGYHKFAELTARKLGMSLNISLQILLERLMVERRPLPEGGLEGEVPPYLPPVGMWDPENVRRLRPDDRLDAVELLDAESQAPTLLVDSEDMTIRSGPAFEYWKRRGVLVVDDRIANARDASPLAISTSSDSPGEVSSVQSSGVGTRFLNILRSLRSKISTVTIPVHPSDIAVVQEEVARGGFRSMVMEPASVYEPLFVVIGRNHPALTQYVDAVKAHASRDIWRSVVLSNVVTFFASMAIVWYNLL
jgi:hypothetical protein